jgi:hypothetical protein
VLGALEKIAQSNVMQIAMGQVLRKQPLLIRWRAPMNYLETRRIIQAAGNEFFEDMYATNTELGNIAGEFMRLNEEYVLNNQGINETYGTVDILHTGFTNNQRKFLVRLKRQMEED